MLPTPCALPRKNRRACIVVCGVGGAYPSSGLRVGDVACAETECYGDLGAASPSGFLDMKALGFPIVDGPFPLFNELPMQDSLWNAGSAS